jgi:hypothetical protein
MDSGEIMTKSAIGPPKSYTDGLESTGYSQILHADLDVRSLPRLLKLTS